MFFGTPEWAVPSLRALLESDIDVAGVVTNPDKPAGRGLKLTPSPVKELAQEASLEVFQPTSARDPELADTLRSLGADAAVVVAYGKILPAALLEVPPLGFVNVHFSLLPEYRGAAPVQRAVMDGRSETGVSIMVLTEGMDEGPVLSMARDAIGPEDTAGDVGARLADMGADLLVSTLPPYAAHEISPVEQDHDDATYAPKITEEQAQIDWERPGDAIHDQVRALNPAPGAWTTWGGDRLKVHETRLCPRSLPPGEIALRGDALLAGTGDGDLELVTVQPATKRRMTGAEFARGHRIEPGSRIG